MFGPQELIYFPQCSYEEKKIKVKKYDADKMKS